MDNNNNNYNNILKKNNTMDASTNTGQRDTITIPVAVTITSNLPSTSVNLPVHAVPMEQTPIQSPPPIQSAHLTQMQPVQAALPPGTTMPPQTASVPSVPNLITVPVPIVHNEDNYVYVMIKGSLHDRSCSVFGLNEEETQAVAKRFENVKPVVNGVMVPVPPVDMVNTLAQLSYKVICSSGEAEICWTMQREI